MKAISLYVPEETYGEFKSLAARTGRPVAAVIREAMEAYLREHRPRKSILDVAAPDCGALLRPWTRSELTEEMV